METTQTKKRTRVTPSKLCVRCNKVLPLGAFYTHRDWQSQACRDAWCKDCVEKFCVDQETLKQYCMQNNRRWSDSFWESSLKKAQYVLSTHPDYLNPKTSAKKRDEIMNKTTCRQFFSMMAMPNFYGYVEYVGDDGVYVEDFERRVKGELVDENPAEKAVYDKTWRGHYTPEQLEILNEEYASYEEDFVLDSASMRDYTRKVIKASLDADIASDKARRGEIPSRVEKEKHDMYDNLSKSANFAACRRKPGEAKGMGSLGEIIFNIEVKGLLNNRGYTGPKDLIDFAIDELDHRMVAAGLRGEV